MTQIEFAQSLEISQATLSEIESGKTKPSFDVLVLLADKYMVDMNWLIINRKVELHFGLQEDELKLLQNYRNLQDIAQEECNAPLCQDTLRTKISYVLPSF